MDHDPAGIAPLPESCTRLISGCKRTDRDSHPLTGLIKKAIGTRDAPFSGFGRRLIGAQPNAGVREDCGIFGCPLYPLKQT